MILQISFKEIKRILSSVGFRLSVALALLILLTSQIHKELDGTVYTVLSAAFELSEEKLIRHNLNAQSSFVMLMTYCLSMYGPLLAALAFAKVLCEEQKYGVRRYLLFKEGKMCYVLSKALSAILTSGLCFLTAGFLLLSFMYWKYPMWTEASPDGYARWLENMLPKMNTLAVWAFDVFGEHAHVLMTLVGAFLYGAFCGFIGFICTAFFSNIYLAVCIPFFFGYIYYSIVQSFDGRLLEGSISYETYNAIHAYVSPEAYVGFWKMKETCTVNMLVLLGVWILAVGIHMICLRKASDCGVSR